MLLPMPEFIKDDKIELHARNNHRFDEDLWVETDKNRIFLREYLTWVDKTNSLNDCRDATEMFTKQWNSGRICAYSLILKASGKAVGSIDIHNIDPDNRKAEIGYWLAERYNGCGYMSRAVQLIEKYSFLCGIHRLIIAVQKENKPSARVAERNQYIYEGTHKDALYKYGSFYDELIFAKINNA